MADLILDGTVQLVDLRPFDPERLRSARQGADSSDPPPHVSAATGRREQCGAIGGDRPRASKLRRWIVALALDGASAGITFAHWQTSRTSSRSSCERPHSGFRERHRCEPDPRRNGCEGQGRRLGFGSTIPASGWTLPSWAVFRGPNMGRENRDPGQTDGSGRALYRIDHLSLTYCWPRSRGSRQQSRGRPVAAGRHRRLGAYGRQSDEALR